MSKAASIFQRVYGILLIVFVGMGTFGWEPPPISDAAKPLWDAIVESAYIMPTVLIVYLATGLAFLFNRYAPLAAVLLMPVSLNILLFHSFLNPRSIPFAATFFIANLMVLFVHHSSYRELLRRRAIPGES